MCHNATLRNAIAIKSDSEGSNETKEEGVRCNNRLPFQLLEMRSLDKKNNLFEKQEIGQPKSTKESTDERDIPPR
jgi:hypothetical protein